MSRQNFHVADDLEGGSALALFLAAAGHGVETDFIDGAAFISAAPLEPEIDIADKNANDMIR